LAAPDLGAGVEQPFNWLIIQNRQAMQSMWKSMEWTLENNMVDSFFLMRNTDKPQKAGADLLLG